MGDDPVGVFVDVEEGAAERVEERGGEMRIVDRRARQVCVWFGCARGRGTGVLGGGVGAC